MKNMPLHHICTCLVISSLLATVAETKPATSNDAHVETQFWQPFSAFQHRHQSLLQPYMHTPSFHLLTAQSPDVYYFNSPQQHPFLLPVPHAPNEITPVAYATTARPIFKDTEPTTERASIILSRAPSKIQRAKQNNFQNDANLLSAVRNINNNFVIEDIVPVPGKRVYAETVRPKIGPMSKAAMPEKLQNSSSRVKVEATGKTSSSGIVPEIPFETYFLPYLSTQILGSGKKPASLILEPHAKAVAGNGGTAISAPISRAVLKRGMPTNVYFNPDSVAIAGVGGKAHAQADLELDLMNRRR